MKTAASRLALALLALSGTAGAQPTPAAAPRAPAAAPPAASAASATPSGEPTLPDIDDPMLAPPPAPTRVLKSWRDAVGMIKGSSTSLRSALARIDQASARATQARAGALPSLTGTADVRQELILSRGPDPATGESRLYPDPSTAFYAQLAARMPIFAPRTWYDHKTAKQAIESASLDEKEVRRQVIAAVADAIVRTITAERLAEVSRVSLKSALSTLDLNKRRAALGASSMLDVVRAEEEAERARAQIVVTTEALMRSREELGLTLGSTQAYGVTPDIRLDSLADEAKLTCHRENDVRSRPDVKAAASRVALAERSVGAVDWSYWPRVEAYSELGYIPLERASPNRLSYTWNVGAVLNWTLFDGGLRSGQKSEARAGVRVAQESLTDTQRRASVEVTQTLRGVNVAEANLTVSARARELSAETARLARVAYLNGSGTSFDLVDTARRQREAELDLAIKEFEVLHARIAAWLALASCTL